ncbi:hypothetical protein MGSAQ_001929, partial [marine sediment metagenome]
ATALCSCVTIAKGHQKLRRFIRAFGIQPILDTSMVRVA